MSWNSQEVTAWWIALDINTPNRCLYLNVLMGLHWGVNLWFWKHLRKNVLTNMVSICKTNHIHKETSQPSYLGSQTSFGVTACCKRYVGTNRIYIHLGTKCAWTTLTDFCWKFVGTIWTAWPTRGDNRRINMLRKSTKPKQIDTDGFFKGFR